MLGGFSHLVPPAAARVIRPVVLGLQKNDTSSSATLVGGKEVGGGGRGTVREALPQERGAETHQSENLLHGLHGVLLDLQVGEMLGCA